MCHYKVLHSFVNFAKYLLLNMFYIAQLRPAPQGERTHVIIVLQVGRGSSLSLKRLPRPLVFPENIVKIIL